MKTHRWFNPNRLVPHLRIASVVTLISAAAAMALVAAKPSGLLLAANSNSKSQAIAKFRQDRDDLFRNKRALPGLDREHGPLLAAMEDYAHRAYPAKDVPMRATLNARAAFEHVKSRTMATTTSTLTASLALPSAAWTLIGPSEAVDPSILTFTGTEYITSGRITALAIAPGCDTTTCQVWVAAAGGGIWRTDNALSNPPTWTFASDSFGTNAIGTLTYDATSGTLYAGTGEPNASADSEAGVGIYKSIDGGNSWTKLADMVTSLSTPGNGTYTGDAFAGRSISSIVPDPNNANVLYVSSTRGVRGVSSVLSGGATTNPPTPRPPFGLFKSTDGGAHFTFIWNGNGTIRGVNHVELDPNYATNNTLYAAAFQNGVWRSTDSGVHWTQIKTALDPNNNTDRAEFAVTELANGKTRMYVGDGNTGSPAARFYRSDDVATGTPVFGDFTNSQNVGYCTGQCWYDNFVVTPAGHPDMVYLGGSFDYGTYGSSTNGRGVLLSTNAGLSFTDMTWDATTASTPEGSCCQPNSVAPNGLHPDQHALVVSSTNPALFFEGSDGGLMRSSGDFADISSQCATPRGLSGTAFALCDQLLSSVPTVLYSLNTGLSTIQFQSLSVAADDAAHLQGGTQDNGTFEHTNSNDITWPQIIYGDGGQSGFNASSSSIRFNSFFGQFHDANFQNGDPSKWVIISAPIVSSPEGSYFYVPIIADPNPANAGTIFEGSQSVWRTQDWGGNPATLEANCPEFTTPGTQAGCGDFVRIGPPGKTDLTSSAYGRDRRGGFVAAIERAKSDTGTLWAATGTGRVFISKNANAAASNVKYTRLDNLGSATAAPGRFVTSIYIDPANSNHAWISYSGYNFNTPSQPGHVFEVTYNEAPKDATWADLDGGTGPMGDLPVTDLVRDDFTGDLYAATDFGVLTLAGGNPANAWVVAGSGLPMVEVAGLTIVPSARVLYAATHGRSAWKLTLP
jgi:hypothetical protein